MSIGNILWWLLLFYFWAPATRATSSPAPSSSDKTELPEDLTRIYASCSRNRSRVARLILKDYLWETVEQLKYALPKDCRLRPNDIYSGQEAEKAKVGRSEWRCMLCNKLFRGEEFLDRHLENRHGNMVDKSRHCLADVCDVVHCDWWEWRQAGPKRRRRSCQPDEALRRRRACEALTQRCFPATGGSTSRQLADFFQRQFCDAHSCDTSVTVFPLGMQKRSLSSLVAVGTALLLVTILGFYACVYSVWNKKGATKLHHLSKRKKAKWLSIWSKKIVKKQS